MNFLIKSIFFIYIFVFSNFIIADENKIIFEVNKNIITTVDFKNRLKFLEIISAANLQNTSEKDLLDDYFSSILFYEYVKNNEYLNSTLKKETNIIFEEITSNYKIKETLQKDTIIKNIQYDFARKIVLENILENHKEYIFSNSKDTNFIYKFSINYITLPKFKSFPQKEFKKILDLNNFDKLKIFLKNYDIDFYSKEVEIKDLNQIEKKIRALANNNLNILFEENLDFYRIINLQKKLDISNGVYYRLVNFETNKKLLKEEENCNFINLAFDIKSNEYEYNKLNDKIKNNLISINDFIIFQNDEIYDYIFLCEIKVSEEFLKNININKKISLVAKDIEMDFINKYSKLYNAKKLYE